MFAIARASQGATWSWCSLNALSICRACRPSADEEDFESDRCFGDRRWETYRSHVYRARAQEGVSGRRGLAECAGCSCDGCQVDCLQRSESVVVRAKRHDKTNLSLGSWHRVATLEPSPSPPHSCYSSSSAWPPLIPPRACPALVHHHWHATRQ